MNSMNCLLYRYPVKRTVHEIHANGDFALTQRVNCDTACQTQHDVVTSWLGGSLSITCMWVFDAKRVFLEDQMLILNDLERHSKKLRASGHEVLESERGKKLRENSVRLQFLELCARTFLFPLGLYRNHVSSAYLRLCVNK